MITIPINKNIFYILLVFVGAFSARLIYFILKSDKEKNIKKILILTFVDFIEMAAKYIPFFGHFITGRKKPDEHEFEEEYEELKQELEELKELKSKEREFFSELGLEKTSKIIFVQIKERLTNEISYLKKKTNVNLSVGVFLAALGIGVFVYVITRDISNKTWIEFASNTIPKISLLVFFELFAYFFLNMYKTSQEEIKYYQAELTSIEIIFTGIIYSSKLSSYDNIIESLIKTERNTYSNNNEQTKTFTDTLLKVIDSINRLNAK